MQQPQETRQVSLVYGLIFGGIIGFIDVVYSAILDTNNFSFLASLSQALSSLNTIEYDIVYSFIVSFPIYILLIVSFLLAGLFAARKTKKASTGMLAGLWVGVLYLVIDLLIATILFDYVFLFPQYAQSGSSASVVASSESSLLTASISYSLVAGLILIFVGLVVGALGGVIGKGETMFTWKFDVWRLPIYLYPLGLVIVEMLLRTLTNADPVEFIGPTIAAVGSAIVLPLFPSRPLPAETLLKDQNTYNKLRNLQQLAEDLEKQGIVSSEFTRPKEREFIGTCFVFLGIITLLWYVSINLELTSTNANFMPHVILSIVLGFFCFVIGVVLSEIRDGMHRKRERMQ